MAEQRVGGSRRHLRIRAPLQGRYKLADGREAACSLIDVSSSGMAIASQEKGRVGQSIVVYIDDMGGVQGKIIRLTNEGFAVQFDAGAAGTKRVANWFAELYGSGGADRPGNADGSAPAQPKRKAGLRPSDRQLLRQLEPRPASEAVPGPEAPPNAVGEAASAAFAAGSWSALRIAFYLLCVWILVSRIWADFGGLMDDSLRTFGGPDGLLPALPDCLLCSVLAR